MPVTKWDAEGIYKKTLDREEQNMGRACVLVQRNIKTLLNVGGGRDHVPSSPGEPPHKQSGQLYGSIFFKVVRSAKEIVGYVYSNDRKSRRLEMGFVGRDRLGRVFDQKARPFMRPGLANSRERLKKLLRGGQ